MKKLLLGFIVLCTTGSIFAQNVEVNAQKFPAIELKVQSDKKLTTQNTTLSQQNKDVPIQIKPISDSKNTTKGNKAIFFIIETSGFTDAKVVQNFKKGIAECMKTAPEGTTFNVASFWKSDANSKTLNPISVEFTDNQGSIIDEMNRQIKSVTEKEPQADIHKAVYEAIEYLQKNAKAPQKQLIVLTAGTNRSYSPLKIEDCIEKANKAEIQVFSVVHKTWNAYASDNFKKLADKTNAETNLVNDANEVSESLANFMKNDIFQTSNGNAYQISFTLADTTNINDLQLSIEGKKIPVSIKKVGESNDKNVPHTTENNNQLFLFIGIGLILALGGGFYFFQQAKKNKLEQEAKTQAVQQQMLQQQQQFQQEQQRLQQQILDQKYNANIPTTPTPIQEPQKFDPKKTFIGGGGGTPTLAVTGQGFNQQFPLHKTVMSVGRKEGNDIVLPIATVSSSHAVFSNENGNWFIADNGSTNGVIVNGNKVQKQMLKQGDKIQLGGALISFNL